MAARTQLDFTSKTAREPAEVNCRQLTRKELKKISKADRDRPTLTILIMIGCWFLFLRFLLHIVTADYVYDLWAQIKSAFSLLF